MKKLLSVLLCVSIAVSLITASTATTFAQSSDSVYDNDALIENLENIVDELEVKQPQKPELAPTSARPLYVSEKPATSYDEFDGYTFGCIGDVDFDDAVSIIDATAIQRHIAEIRILNATACKLSDTDMDSKISIMDVTAIQLYIAEKSNNEYINHILYSPIETSLEDAFDEIGEFVLNNGEFSIENGDYFVESTQTTEDAEVTMRIGYFPDENHMSEPDITLLTTTYIPEYDSYCYLVMNFSRDTRNFSFYLSEYTDDFDLYQLWGDGKVVNITEDYEFEFKFTKRNFSSDYGVTYEQVEEMLSPMCLMNIILAEEYITNDILGSVLDLVYDLSLLL